MVDFGFELDDYVRLKKGLPNIVFRIEFLQYEPPSDWSERRNTWKPRAYLHFAGGAGKFGWSLLARWEPMENLIKLNEMETLAMVAR